MDFDFTSELNSNRDKSALLLSSLQYEITISLGLIVYLHNFQFSGMQLAIKNLATCKSSHHFSNIVKTQIRSGFASFISPISLPLLDSIEEKIDNF